MVEAAGYQKLVTSLYPDGDDYLSSDAVFGVKKSLVVVSSIDAIVICLVYLTICLLAFDRGQ